MQFSLSTGLFYDGRIHKDVPGDAVDVSGEQFQELSTGRNAGKQIVFQAGHLVLVDPAPFVLTREEEAARERAWRDQEVSRTAWLRERHRDEQDLQRETTLDGEQFGELLSYLQELRDWPQSAQFPVLEHRPVTPPWIADQTQ
ncbi:phage tail assembly chaperone [Pseudomonas sp.]|uniref:phage tail assembly chaperone n=1 Tax=Pseudomonas sp. TaxID=306 RepID=UPI00289D7B92|nr:phage tail assembly chaperone [Pseudomonas sp.]